LSHGAAAPSNSEEGRLHAQRQWAEAEFATTEAERREGERDSAVLVVDFRAGAPTVTEDGEAHSAKDEPMRLVDERDPDFRGWSPQGEGKGFSPRPLQEGQGPQPPQSSAGGNTPEDPPRKPSDAATSASPPAKDDVAPS